MDYERSVLSTIFCDYTPQEVWTAVNGGASIKDFMAAFPYRLARRLKHFTIGDLQRVTDVKITKYSNKRQYPQLTGTLYDLREVSASLLSREGKALNIPFKKLLRWHELSVELDEDLLICAYLPLASMDIEQSDLLWDNALLCSDSPIGDIIKKGLTDLHFHLGSSGDGFSLKWIETMNVLQANMPIEDDYRWVKLAAIVRYILYKVAVLEQSLTEQEQRWLKTAVMSKTALNSSYEQAMNQIGTLRKNAAKIKDGNDNLWDYAIQQPVNSDSPYALLLGERWFLYKCFYALFVQKNMKFKAIASYLYFYVVVKIYYRHKLLLLNRQLGLTNYHNVVSNKLLSNEQSQSPSMRYKYAVQTGGLNRKNYIEARVAKDAINTIRSIDLASPFMGQKSPRSLSCGANNIKNLSFVISWSKPRGKDTRDIRNKEWEMICKHQLDACLEEKHKNPQNPLLIKGLDFAGSDTHCRPYVFARLVRYARMKDFYNLTYHVGEDFFDLIDGLRAVDEVLFYLRWDRNCRLSHLLSLGIDAGSFYQNRRYNMMLPRQILLDNIVWIITWEKRLNIAFANHELFMGKAEKLYAEIGYSSPWNIEDYISSLLLRGEFDISLNKQKLLDPFDESKYDRRRCVNKAWNTPNAVAMFREYNEKEKVYTKGEQMVTWRMPKDESIYVLLNKIQNRLIKTIKSRHIAIETCPTSNITIGDFEQYGEHPLFRFIKQQENERPVSVSINTDIKGLLPTSIEREYLLVSASMEKKKHSDEDIQAMVRKITRNSNQRRFK